MHYTGEGEEGHLPIGGEEKKIAYHHVPCITRKTSLKGPPCITHEKLPTEDQYIFGKMGTLLKENMGALLGFAPPCIIFCGRPCHYMQNNKHTNKLHTISQVQKAIKHGKINNSSDLRSTSELLGLSISH